MTATIRLWTSNEVLPIARNELSALLRKHRKSSWLGRAPGTFVIALGAAKFFAAA